MRCPSANETTVQQASGSTAAGSSATTTTAGTSVSYSEALPRRVKATFRERYTLGRVIGLGCFSTVRVAVDRETGEEWACKIVTEEAERETLLVEVDILRQLEHPCVVKYREHFDAPDHLYIITELLRGPDLLSAVVSRGSYSEEDAGEIMRQVLSALAYLGSKGIAHRDLKLGNFVLVSDDDHTTLKLIDFGLAGQLSASTLSFHETCGTPSYVAPEVAAELPYGPQCDLWAAGVVLYMLLSGDLPFHSNSARDLLRILCRPQLRFGDPVWEITSSGAKDLIKALLTADPAERLTAEAALGHRWLCGEPTSSC